MGTLNVIPDSFSNGGYWSSSNTVIERAVQMVDEGANLIDIGGESTRPNSTRISEEEEWSRISTVLCALADQGVVCSVGTLHATTTLRVADAGATTINDISGGHRNPRVNAVLVKTGLTYVVQHYRALPGMPGESFNHSEGLMGTLKERINTQVRGALDTGVAPEMIVIDPGLDFSLANEQYHAVLDDLGTLSSLGYPVLIDASRKRFIVAIGGDRNERTSIITCRCARERIWAVRVHEIRRNAHAAREGNEVGR